jgi:hypothetical protein
MMLKNKYLEDVANEIQKVIFSFSVWCDFIFFAVMKFSCLVFFIQVVEYNALSYSSVDMSEDEDSGLDKEESEDDGSDSEETEIMDSTLSDS